MAEQGTNSWTFYIKKNNCTLVTDAQKRRKIEVKPG
jgi:hypothetical protein